MKKIYIIAGEASGDLHASRLMKEIKKQNQNVEFRFFGGDLMKKQGGTLVKHYRELAFMGIWEVMKNIKTIKNNMLLCQKDILEWQADIIILVDYPGFNLRIAEFTYKLGIKTHYYISPKVWVWKKSRVKKIKLFIDKMFVIFPFEVEFYKTHNYNVHYVGNPTVDVVSEELSKPFDEKKFRKENKISDKPIIALLPGSRLQEVTKMLPIMLTISEHFKNYQFVVAGVSVLNKSIYDQFTYNSDLKVIYDKTYELLKSSYAAVVTSGTATLETALFKVPQVVCYKTGKFSYIIGKQIVKIDFFSLVNILMKKEVVKELLQNNLEKDIIQELKRLTSDKTYRSKILVEYKNLANLLGNAGSPAQTAQLILNNSPLN